MHPKEPFDLDVTDDEFNNALATHEWFDQKCKELQNLMMDKILRDDGFSSEEIRKLHEDFARILFEHFWIDVAEKIAAEYCGKDIAES